MHTRARSPLHDYRARRDDISMTDVPHAQPHQIARSQLAVDGEVEGREFTGASIDLQSYSGRPDVLQSQRSFLPNELALIARSLRRRNMASLGGRLQSIDIVRILLCKRGEDCPR